MSEKEELLAHISEIKSHLVDKQAFFPYNYNAIFVWSGIALFLTLFMVSMYEQSIVIGSLGTAFVMGVGFVSEGIMTKRVNRDYDIEDCTLRQRFIMQTFLMLSLFLIVLSATLAIYKLYIPIYLTWLFLISMGFFALGFVLNIKAFMNLARFNVTLSIFMLGMGWYQEHLVGSDSICFRIVQAVLIVGLTILPSLIAWKLKKGTLGV